MKGGSVSCRLLKTQHDFHSGNLDFQKHKTKLHCQSRSNFFFVSCIGINEASLFEMCYIYRTQKEKSRSYRQFFKISSMRHNIKIKSFSAHK